MSSNLHSDMAHMSDGLDKSSPEDSPQVLAQFSSLDDITLPIRSSARLKYTCLSVCTLYIVCGTNTGSLYLFMKDDLSYRLMIPTEGEGSITHVLFSPTDDNLFAYATSKGILIVVELMLKKSSKFEKQRLIRYHEGKSITALVWNQLGNKIFSGDNHGNVSTLNVSIVKAKDLVQIPSGMILKNLDSAVIQLQCSGDQLLVSTLTRSYLCNTDKANFSQIGKKLRDGPFGACFFQPAKSQAPVIYCGRPGSRMWEVDNNRTVLSTHQFKQLLLRTAASPVISVLSETVNRATDPVIHPSVNFKKLLLFGHQYIVTWSDHGLYVISPAQVKLVLWNAEFTDIQDIVCDHNDLYLYRVDNIITKVTMISVEKCIARLFVKKELVLCADLCSKFSSHVMLARSRYHIPTSLLTELKDYLIRSEMNGHAEKIGEIIRGLVQNVDVEASNSVCSSRRGSVSSIDSAAAVRLESGIYVVRTKTMIGYDSDDEKQSKSSGSKPKDNGRKKSPSHFPQLDSVSSHISQTSLVSETRTNGAIENIEINNGIDGAIMSNPVTVEDDANSKEEIASDLNILENLSKTKDGVDNGSLPCVYGDSPELNSVVPECEVQHEGTPNVHEQGNNNNSAVLTRDTDPKCPSKIESSSPKVMGGVWATSPTDSGYEMDDPKGADETDDASQLETKRDETVIKSGISEEDSGCHDDIKPKECPGRSTHVDESIASSVLSSISAVSVAGSSVENDSKSSSRRSSVTSLSSSELMFAMPTLDPEPVFAKSERPLSKVKPIKKRASMAEIITPGQTSQTKKAPRKKRSASASANITDSEKNVPLVTSSGTKEILLSSDNVATLPALSTLQTTGSQNEASSPTSSSPSTNFLSKSSFLNLTDNLSAKISNKTKTLLQKVKESKLLKKNEVTVQLDDVGIDRTLIKDGMDDTSDDGEISTMPSIDLHHLEEVTEETRKKLQDPAVRYNPTALKDTLSDWLSELHSVMQSFHSTLNPFLNQSNQNVQINKGDNEKDNPGCSEAIVPEVLKTNHCEDSDVEQNECDNKSSEDVVDCVADNETSCNSLDIVNNSGENSPSLTQRTIGSDCQGETTEATDILNGDSGAFMSEKDEENLLKLSVSMRKNNNDNQTPDAERSQALDKVYLNDPFRMDEELHSKVSELTMQCFDMGLVHNTYEQVQSEHVFNIDGATGAVDIPKTADNNPEMATAKASKDWRCFVRCYFHFLDISRVRQTIRLWSEDKPRLVVWQTLVECLSSIDDLVTEKIKENNVEAAFDLMRSGVHNKMATLSHVTRLFTINPTKTINFTSEIRHLVSPLDILYTTHQQGDGTSKRHFLYYMKSVFNKAHPDDRETFSHGEQAGLKQGSSKYLTLCDDPEVERCWLEYLLQEEVNEKTSLRCDCGWPRPGGHLLVCKEDDILSAIIKLTSRKKVLLEKCRQYGYWEGYLKLCPDFESSETIVKMVLQLGDMELIKEFAKHGYILKTVDDWRTIMKLRESQQTGHHDIDNVQHLLKGNLFCLNCGVNLQKDDTNKTGVLTQADGQALSVVPWESLARLFVKNVGPVQACDILINLNIPEGALTIGFYQSCVLATALQRKQRLIVHSVLEKTDTYLWSKRPSHLPPNLLAAITDEMAVMKARQSGIQADVSEQLFACLSNQSQRAQRRAIEESQIHWGVGIDLHRSCAVCSLPLSCRLSTASQPGVQIFTCGHGFHKHCILGASCIVCLQVGSNRQ